MTVKHYTNARVELLLGQDNWPLIVSRELREIRNTGLVVSRTLLGWSVHGYINQNSTNKNVYSVDQMELFANGDDEVTLDELVRRYFVIDNLGVFETNSLHCTLARSRKILEVMTRQMGSVWETGLLWKHDSVPECDGRATAYKRLIALEKRFEREPKYAKLFRREMKRLIDKGYVVRAPKRENYPRIWYSPTFGVTNANKPGKLRIVVDAAAKTEA